MSTDLSVLQQEVVAPSKYGDEKVFEEVAKAGDWLPRLQLFGSNSDAAKEGKIQMGHFGLVRGKDNIVDLGVEIDILVLSWRPKAMSVGGDEVISSFNPETPLFKELQAKSDEQNSGCMFGPEYLVWVPNHGFATLYMSSKSARNEAPKVKGLLGKAATLSVTLAVGKKYKWHVIVCNPCSDFSYQLPTMDELRTQRDKFNNPPEKDVELATDTTDRVR